MKKFSFNPKLTFLGIVGIAVSVAVLPLKAHGQTESYITDADEAASCAGVCNTFVPPQTEEECEEFNRDRFSAETDRHSNRMSALSKRRGEELEESSEIFTDEYFAGKAVLDERTKIAKRVCATRITGAAAGLTACLAAITVTGPAAIPGIAICSGLYSAAVAGFVVTLNREVSDAVADFQRDKRIAREDWDDRDEKIKALYDDRLIPNEESRHMSTLDLILEDLRLCVERVNG